MRVSEAPPYSLSDTCDTCGTCADVATWLRTDAELDCEVQLSLDRT